LMARCRELAAKIASRGPLAIATVKKAVLFGLNVDLPSGCAHETAQFGAGFASEDMKEGCAAFLEKRQPNFTGR